MTKSDYIRARIQPLIRMVKPMVHEEERDTVAAKIEVWAMRLIMDVENLSHNNLDEIQEKDFPYTEKDL